MMASLTGMEVSNASLYDGASALAEACLMAVRAHRKSKSARILVPAALNPTYRRRGACDHRRAEPQVRCAAVRTGERHAAVPRRSTPTRARTSPPSSIQQPNFFGLLEDVDAITDWAQANNALLIAVVNPLSLALLKPPGEWGTKGADIVVGDGQPFGVPLSSGGPYFGFMTTRMEHVRQMPGRIIGRTVDLDGKPGFTLTLQAREQHIRRSKATSNICTNQGLLVTAATIHMSLLGAAGLEKVAAASQTQTQRAGRGAHADQGREAGIRRSALPRSRAAAGPQGRATCSKRSAQRGIVGGYDLSRQYPELGNALLVCATETRTDEDIAAYAAALAEVLESATADELHARNP